MYTIELRLDTRGYDDYLEKKFKYGYKLKRALVNYFNMQENRRVNSDRYKELAERMKELNTRQDIIKDTTDKGRKKLLKEAYEELSEEVKKGWIELNDSYGLGNGKFVNYKKLGQASVMYERYASEGIINWSSFESMAQATKQGYLKRRKQADNATTTLLQTVYDLEKEGTTLYSLIFSKERMKFALLMPWKDKRLLGMVSRKLWIAITSGYILF